MYQNETEETMQISVIPEPKKIIEDLGGAAKAAVIERKINQDLREEEYRLQLKKEGISIAGGSERACLYAEATLEQLKLQFPQSLPCLTIEDEPSHPWRAFHIDCARHFFPTDELKKMIKMCAHFKMNRFHWHFMDDQGWRIECNRYPLLHQIGAVRRGDHFGCWNSEEIEDRYYTRDEVRGIVSFCDSLGIEVVPEVDMPGHATAILAAYPELGCKGERLEVATKQGIFWDILCCGKEEVFTFIENVLDDLMELFPSKYFHIGGDEAPKERWKNCPLCQKRMEEERLTSVQQLQGYMENRITAYLKEKGRTAIVWNEAANGGNLDSDTIVQLWIEEKEHMVKLHLEHGGKAIISPVKNCYCDYPYGMTSLEAVYQLDDYPAELAGAEVRILGTECLAWTEYIRDSGKLETMCWPRYAASAEVGWCGRERPGYSSFEKRLKVLLPVFEKYGIQITDESGWVPQEEEARRQKEEFQKNFGEGSQEELEKVKEEI